MDDKTAEWLKIAQRTRTAGFHILADEVTRLAPTIWQPIPREQSVRTPGEERRWMRELEAQASLNSRRAKLNKARPRKVLTQTPHKLNGFYPT
jgi:hypothetical protein